MKCYKRLLLFGIFLFASVFNSFAAEVAVDINSPNLNIGDTASITIDLVNFPTTHGGGVNVFYNQKVIKVTAVQISPAWSFVNRSGIIDNNRGQVKDIFFSHFNGLEGNIPVATIQVVAIGEGASNIVVAESDANPFADGNGVIPVTINNKVSSVVVQSNQPNTENAETGVAADTQTSTDTTAATDATDSVLQDTTISDTGDNKSNQQDNKASGQVAKEANAPNSNKQNVAASTTGNNLVLINTAHLNSGAGEKADKIAETDQTVEGGADTHEAILSANYSNRQERAPWLDRQSQSASRAMPGRRDTNHIDEVGSDDIKSPGGYSDNAADSRNTGKKQYGYSEDKEDASVNESYIPQEGNTGIGLYISVGMAMLFAILALIAINRNA